MKTILLDTNGFLRFLLNDIPSQADKIEKIIILAKEKQVTILVPQIIIFEISFVLEKYYQLKKEDIIEKLKALISAPYFTIESSEIFLKAFILYADHSIGLVDSFLSAKANLENAELVTFDKKLEKLHKQ